MDPREHLLRRQDVDPKTIDEILLIAMETQADLPAGTLVPDDFETLPALPGLILDQAVAEYARRKNSGFHTHIQAARARSRRRETRQRQGMIAGGVAVLVMLLAMLAATLMASTGADRVALAQTLLDRQAQTVDRTLIRQADQADALSGLLPSEHERLGSLAGQLRSRARLDVRLQAADAVSAIARESASPDDASLVERHQVLRRETLEVDRTLTAERQRLIQAHHYVETTRGSLPGRLAVFFGLAP